MGRLTVVVANLAPRKMKFGTSEGMVLAAGGESAGLYLLSPDSGAAPACASAEAVRPCSAPMTSTRSCRRPSARAAATSGCRPYAEAIVAGAAAINQCPPGGAVTISALARTARARAPAAEPAQRHRRTVARRADRRGGLHRLRQVPASVPGGCDPRSAQTHAHGAVSAVHRVRTVRRALPRRLHPHGAASRGWRTRRPHPARRENRARFGARNCAPRAAGRQPRGAVARAQAGAPADTGH